MNNGTHKENYKQVSLVDVEDLNKCDSCISLRSLICLCTENIYVTEETELSVPKRKKLSMFGACDD